MNNHTKKTEKMKTIKYMPAGRRALRLALLAVALHSSPLAAQTQTEQYQPGVTQEGAVYFLPKTAVRVSVLIEKTSYRPGDFARYAQRYLRLNNVSLEPSVSYRVVGLTAVPIGVADTAKAFAVKFNARTVAANVALADDGRLLAINAEPRAAQLPAPFRPAVRPAPVNPRQYMNEEILAAGSTAKMAELTAREIYDLRENRSLLIKGQADFMPTDGAQMQFMLGQISQQDQALTQLFQGVTECDTTEHVVVMAPEGSTTRQPLFRLSQRRGLVDKDDLSGEPFYISVDDITALPAADEGKGKKHKTVETGIYVNVPGKMRVTIFHGAQQLQVVEMPAAQFGHVELLSGELFNKRYTTRLWLSPVSGAVDRLEAEQPK